MIKALFLVQEVSKKPAPFWDGSKVVIRTEATVTLTAAYGGGCTPQNSIFAERQDRHGWVVSGGKIEMHLSSLDAAAFFEDKIGKDVHITFE